MILAPASPLALALLVSLAVAAAPGQTELNRAPAPRPPESVSAPGNVPVKVMDYRDLRAPATLTFHPTQLAPGGGGQAELEPGKNAVKIHALFTNLSPAARLGRDYLTYVLWGISPQGRSTNLGEIGLVGTEGQFDGRFDGKTGARRFGLIVTAEPYFAVSQPGPALVFEADLTPGTPGVATTQAECMLRPEPASAVPAATAGAAPDPALPLVLEEARWAIAAAREAGANTYAPDTFGTAEQLFRLGEDQQARGAKAKDVEETGVEAVLIAEDARVLAVARQRRARQAGSERDPSR